MIQIETTMSNEGARAALREFKSFEVFLTEKIAGDRQDRHDTATIAYVIWRSIRDAIRRQVVAQDERAEKDRRTALEQGPSVRQQRGR